jgi:hypothetical protein
MSYTYKAVALAWLLVFGLFALVGSGMVVGSWVLLLVGAALVMPALILRLCAKPQSTVGVISTAQEPAVVVSAVRGRRSSDSRRIDVNRWENEGGARRAA